MNKRTEKIITATYTILALASVSTGLGISTGIYITINNIGRAYSKLYNQLYNQASIIADVNKDGVTTQDEWINAYQRANQKLLTAKFNPKKFSNEDLETIIKYGQ